MALKVITPPAAEPLSLAEAKARLRVDGDTDDAVITALIQSAREYCEDYQGKKYITQTLELILDSYPWGDEIEFRDCSPVQSITSIKYTDSAGTENTVSADEYILDNVSFVNRVIPAYNKQWPTDTLQPVNGVAIRFVAGYGNASAVPEAVKQAMVLHIKALYDDYKPDERERLEKARDALLGMRRVVNV